MKIRGTIFFCEKTIILISKLQTTKSREKKCENSMVSDYFSHSSMSETRLPDILAAPKFWLIEPSSRSKELSLRLIKFLGQGVAAYSGGSPVSLNGHRRTHLWTEGQGIQRAGLRGPAQARTRPVGYVVGLILTNMVSFYSPHRVW